MLPDSGTRPTEWNPGRGVSRIHLAIVSDIRLYRDGIRQVLGEDPRLEITAAASPRDLSLSHRACQRWDVVLADALTLLRLQFAEAILTVEPAPRLVAFGIPEEDDTALACARFGATGLVAADDPLADVVGAVHVVASGAIYCSPRLTALFVREVAGSYLPPAAAETALLTRREAEITAMLKAGASNKAIARQLGIEVTTVKTHVHNILAKLQIHRREEAAARGPVGSRRIGASMPNGQRM